MAGKIKKASVFLGVGLSGYLRHKLERNINTLARVMMKSLKNTHGFLITVTERHMK